MPYKIEWFDKKQRVILIRVSGEFTLDESRSSSEEIRQHIVAGTAPVHLIGDLSEMKKAPFKISEIRNAQGSLSELATTIIVGSDNPIIKFMANVLAKLGGYEVRVVDSVAEAQVVLTKLDPSLKHLEQAVNS